MRTFEAVASDDDGEIGREMIRFPSPLWFMLAIADWLKRPGATGPRP